MMHRLMAVAVLLLVVLSRADAQTQAPLLPPTAPPSFTPSITPTETPTLTLTPSVTPTVTLTQTETLDPQITLQPLNLDLTSDVLFPVGIAFRLKFTTPLTRVESITLDAAQDGWEGQSLDIDVANVAADESGTSQLNYLWESPQHPPAIFEPLTFTWTVVPRGGFGETLKVETVWADPRFEWAVDVSVDAPVRVSQPKSRTNANVARSQIALLARLLASAGHEILPLNAVIFPSNSTPNPCIQGDTLTGATTATVVDCDPAKALAIYDSQSWTPLRANTTEPIQYALTQSILRSAFPDFFAEDHAPDWFRYGVTAYLAGLYSPNDLASMRAASRNNLLLPLDTAPSNEVEVRDWRTQSVGVVIYMASQTGVSGLLDVMNRIDAGESLIDIWPEITGQVLPALVPAWRSWIFTPQGEAAYTLLPSLDPTPTLVPTRTATYTRTFTPTYTYTHTLTPSHTPTQTPTPTDTLTGGFMRPTAAPSLTPTITPLPSVTARPAEAFVLGDLPDEGAPAQNTPSVITTAVVVGIALALTLLVAIILILRRR